MENRTSPDGNYWLFRKITADSSLILDCVNTDSSAVTDSELISGDVMSANVMDETQNDLDQSHFLVVSEDDES